MERPRKPVNLFAARSRRLAYATAMRTDAMYEMDVMDGMEETKVATKGSHGTKSMEERTAIRDEVNELEGTETRMEAPSSPLAHPPSPSSGETDSPLVCAGISTTATAHQSDQPEPDDRARAGSSALSGPAIPRDTSGQKAQESSATGPAAGTGQTAAAGSAGGEIIFRLKDGSAMPLSAYGDLSQLAAVAFPMLRRMAARYELKPASRVTREQLLESIRRLRSSRAA